MNVGDKVKVIKGEYTAWQGEVVDLYGATWAAVDIRYRDQHTTATVPPDYLQVLKPAPPVVEQWEYYYPLGDDEA